MKFSTTKEALFSALNETNKVIPIRTTLPVLSCVLLKAEKEELTIIATDLEQTIVSKIKTKTTQEGQIALPNHRFLEIVAALPSGEITIEAKEDLEVEINSIHGTYKIIGKEPTEYPETPTLKQEQKLKLKGIDFLDIINHTLFATSKDDLKPALCGVYLNIQKEQLTAVATDGHRLVKYKKTLGEKNPEGAIIVPGKFFSILKNTINTEEDVYINISENHIDVTEKNTTTITRIIKEKFPDFNSVIPEELNIKASVNSTEILNAIKRVVIFSNKTTKQINLTFDNNEIIVSTEDQETRSSAKERVSCEYQNKSLSVSYNAQYLKEVIQHLDHSTTEVFLSGPLTAAVFKPKEENTKTDLVSLLMPLRTKN